MYKKLAGLIIGVLALQGCQTVSQGMTGLFAERYQNMIPQRCVIGYMQDGGRVGGDTRMDNGINVYGIVEGKDKWRRIDASAKGLRANFYHNARTGEFVCGWNGWRKKNLVDVFSDPIIIGDKIDLSKTNPKQRVMCEINMHAHIEMSETECVSKGANVIRKIASLPAGMDRQSYVSCQRPDESSPVTFKAGACIRAGGTITSKKP